MKTNSTLCFRSSSSLGVSDPTNQRPETTRSSFEVARSDFSVDRSTPFLDQISVRRFTQAVAYFLHSCKTEGMEKTCSLLVHFDKGTPALANEIKEALEGHDDDAKIDAMKKAVMLLLNGETLPQLFITIVRYVLPSENHTVQKLLLL
ncbi:hypothetical protein L1987_53866 [Smallanthus sonchifolius]|uniref:Uncharacterized protein n=1 Tax=Smallanthus sonchifolius TaxID=185202 RepID=A0ACB9EXQ1_9ASTR|nr:hypothetical protein L1987_53866 [Smallanthus sonchifolius]